MKRHFKAFWILLPVAALLSSCEGSPFTDQDFANKIFPNGYWDFLIQLIAFILLLLIVFFLGYKPLKKMMKKRSDAINAMVEDTKQNQAIAKEAAQQKDQTIEEGRVEAEQILNNARRQAEFERQRVIEDANAEAARRLQKADEDIASAKAASLEETRKEIIDVAMLASTQLLGRDVDEEDNRRLVASFVDELNDKDGDGR